MSNRVGKQFCPSGHDTYICGRNKRHGGCTDCTRLRAESYRVSHKKEKTNYNKRAYAEQKDARVLERKEYDRGHREQINSRVRERKKKDPLFKLSSCLRIRVWVALKARFWRKTTSFSNYIGCSLEELKSHLEKQFLPGMSWENHTQDGWHVDHIIPLDSAVTEKELYKLMHYSNLQPLWAVDNLRKSNKISGA